MRRKLTVKFGDFLDIISEGNEVWVGDLLREFGGGFQKGYMVYK